MNESAILNNSRPNTAFVKVPKFDEAWKVQIVVDDMMKHYRLIEKAHTDYFTVNNKGI